MARKPTPKSMTQEEMYAALPPSLQNEAIREICGMFIEARMEQGFPFTARAFKIVINKYDWTPEMLAASLLCAMERGWRGVFLPDGKIYAEYAESYRRMYASACRDTIRQENQFQGIMPPLPPVDEQAAQPQEKALPEWAQRMMKLKRENMQQNAK